MTGEEVKRARIRLGLTQEELARRMGISQARVSQVEGGARNLNDAELDKLRAVLSEAVVATGSIQPNPQPTNFQLAFNDTWCVYLKIENMELRDAIRYIEFALQEMKSGLSREQEERDPANIKTSDGSEA